MGHKPIAFYEFLEAPSILSLTRRPLDEREALAIGPFLNGLLLRPAYIHIQKQRPQGNKSETKKHV